VSRGEQGLVKVRARVGRPALKPTRFRLQVDPIEALSERIAQRKSHFSPTGKSQLLKQFGKTSVVSTLLT